MILCALPGLSGEYASAVIVRVFCQFKSAAQTLAAGWMRYLCIVMHELFMLRCLELASRGGGYVAPNPMVGSVITHNGCIIGEGYHKRFGGSHAEVEAFNAVHPNDRHLLPEATWYVSLEPCNHFGKTPPCTDLILSSGVRRVVVGAQDPNPLVAGSGIKRLRAEGIEVITDVLTGECRALNKAFFCLYERHRPFITLKWAESADGFIALPGGVAVHLSNPAADTLVHRLRADHMAILIGARTALNDNPRLTTRLWNGPDPQRLVIDTYGELRSDLHLFDGTAETTVFTVNTLLQVPYAYIVPLSAEQEVLPQIMEYLWGKQIHSLLVEGGTATLNHFLASGLFDAALRIQTPQVLQHGIPAPDTSHLAFSLNLLGDNRILQAENPLHRAAV